MSTSEKTARGMSSSSHEVLQPVIAVITGTHSSGKSTVLRSLEQGKLTDIGIHDQEYDDFGYGVIATDQGERPLITIPEAARTIADAMHRPDRLAQNYTLDFQLLIDPHVQFRTHTAASMATAVTRRLIEIDSLHPTDAPIQPVILSDRGPLDGVIYSEARITDRDTNLINGSPRTGFHVEWLKSFIDMVAITDHMEVPFETDKARLRDVAFREQIAQSIADNYTRLFPEDSIVKIHGNKGTRTDQLKNLLGTLTPHDHSTRQLTQYRDWQSIKIHKPSQE